MTTKMRKINQAHKKLIEARTAYENFSERMSNHPVDDNLMMMQLAIYQKVADSLHSVEIFCFPDMILTVSDSFYRDVETAWVQSLIKRLRDTVDRYEKLIQEIKENALNRTSFEKLHDSVKISSYNHVLTQVVDVIRFLS